MNRLKAFFRKPVVFGFICFALGAYSYWAVERLLSHFQFSARYTVTRNSGLPPVDEEDGDFDQSRDPFQEMERMQKQMMKHFGQMPTDGDTGGMHLFFQNGGTGAAVSSGEMKTREDEKFIYYDIDLGGTNPTNFNVKVEDGLVTVTGTVEKKTDTTSVSSSFERSFPAPANTDSRKVEFDNQNGKITLKFPKKA